MVFNIEVSVHRRDAGTPKPPHASACRGERFTESLRNDLQLVDVVVLALTGRVVLLHVDVDGLLGGGARREGISEHGGLTIH
jgi:hypothetical protein